mmetsp:Transcript_8529/g.11518  ORF Transcript_8529/g.11518 Transcript_8529/m.11518 type:complete len:116 (+) Transcript_8529:74-421(+)|eukprot:CAMPEP_0201488574 /NCGR_PEP_ID=MMETSP0151_2-20130828/19118_1 /ASSEMBLY_ACC=CAM_ASM_000257 /TAXON_ID=200890 /ORGANISM="Paramoeba atlantica, Strain 621/1 / CCAP 1560/9" /LENGTH=115 /DNA_ID=CAMNT_0047873895 /DNA_START=49 /DNA_END=396 /DNA_ORIENTATION=+
MDDFRNFLEEQKILEFWEDPLVSPNNSFEVFLCQLRNEFELMMAHIQLRKKMTNHDVESALSGANEKEQIDFYNARLNEEIEAAVLLLMVNTKEAIKTKRTEASNESNPEHSEEK